MLLPQVMVCMSVSPDEHWKQKPFFETRRAVKIGFSMAKNFCFALITSLKSGQKSHKKRPLRFPKFFQIFCKTPASKGPRVLFPDKAVFSFDTPPSPPPPIFSTSACETGIFWQGIGLSRYGHQHGPKAECADQPYILSWPMVISNSVNEFFVAV